MQKLSLPLARIPYVFIRKGGREFPPIRVVLRKSILPTEMAFWIHGDRWKIQTAAIWVSTAT